MPEITEAIENGRLNANDIELFRQNLSFSARMAVAASLPDSEGTLVSQLADQLGHLERLAALTRLAQPVLPDSPMLQAIVHRLADSLRASAHALDSAWLSAPEPDCPAPAQ